MRKWLSLLPGLPLAALIAYALLLCVQAWQPPAAHELTPVAAPVRMAALPAADTEGLVELNRADAAQLMSLPGIGEKTAAAILALREELGGFHYREELLQVHGLGVGKLNAIYDLIYIEEP